MKLEIHTHSKEDCRAAVVMLSALIAADGCGGWISYDDPKADQSMDTSPGPAPVAQPAEVEQPVQPDQAPVKQAPEPVEMTVKEANEIVAEIVKRKPGRPRKAPAQLAPQAAQTAPVVQPPKPIDIDALRAALQRFTAAHGMPAGIELLRGFDCARISELAEKDESSKAAFMAKCPEPVAEAA